MHSVYPTDNSFFQIMQLRTSQCEVAVFSTVLSCKCTVKSRRDISQTMTFFPCALLFLIPLRELISEPCLFPQQLVNVSVEFLLPRTSNQLNSRFPKHFDMKQNLATPLKQQQSASVSLLRPRSVRSNHFWEILGNH